MNKCPKCGFENPNESSYCMNCGTRLDGKLMCPNCRNLVDADDKVCPKCGNKLPHDHDEEDTKKDIEFRARRDRQNHVWQIVFTAVIMGLLVLSVFVSLLSTLKVSSDISPESILRGSGLYYLTFEWGEALKDASSLSGVYKYREIFLPSVRFVLSLLNIVGCLVVAIMAVVKGIKQLKKKAKCECDLYYLAAIGLGIQIFSNAILLSTYSYYSSNAVTYSEIFSNFIGLFVGDFIAMMAYRIYFLFDKNKKSMMIQNIILCLGFLCGLTLISRMGDAYINYLSANYEAGMVNVLYDSIYHIASGVGDLGMYITNTSMSAGAHIIATLIGIVAIIYFAFFIKGFFDSKPEDVKCKIPCYLSSVLIFILSTILLVTGLANAFVIKAISLNIDEITFNTFKTIVSDNTFVVLIGDSISTTISMAFILLGTSAASLIIVRKYNKNMKIINARKEISK